MSTRNGSGTERTQAVLAAVGGPENVVQAWHCITRLRFTVRDRARVDLDRLRDTPGVAGAQFSGDQLQVIIGTDVEREYRALAERLGEPATADAPATARQGWARFGPRRIADLLLETLSGIFTPILPAIVGAGLLKGVLALLVQLGWLTEGGEVAAVWEIVADGTFYFLPFLVAASAAKRFGTDLSLSMAVPAALLYPTLVEGAALIGEGGAEGLAFGPWQVPFVTYSSAVIPPILGVYLLSWVHHGLTRVIPPALRIVVVPLVSLVVTIPVVLVVLAPLGHYAGGYLSEGSLWLFDHGGVLAGALLGGLMPLIVITGMHYAFFPATFQTLASRGYDVILLPFNLVANLATAGATMAVAIRHRRLRSLAISTGLPAFLGITEPAIYGVTLRLKRPFYFTLAGGAVGGAYAALFGLKCFGFAVPGLASLPLYVNADHPANILHAVVAIALSFSIAFGLTLAFCRPDPEPAAPEPGQPTGTLAAPLAGRVLPLAQVPDPTFADGLLGPGVAVDPTGDVVVAPFDGTVEVLPGTAHALALRSTGGTEVLIHIGLDTVGLDGAPFRALVAQGDRITRGQELIRFDRARIEAAGLSPVTPVVITNAALIGEVRPATGATEVATGDPLLTLPVADGQPAIDTTRGAH